MPHEKTNSDNTLYSLTFSIDNSNCSKLKWWMILLIVVGILLILATAFAISIYKIKSFRSKFLPFDRRKRNSYHPNNEFKKNELYNDKIAKVNPIYE